MRPFIADHVMFDECIAELRLLLGSQQDPPPDAEATTGYLLFDFDFRQTMHYGPFTLLPTKAIDLHGPYRAYVSSLQLEPMHHFRDGKRFAIALSTVLSFASGHVVKASRTEWQTIGIPIKHALEEAAQMFPVLFAGPGAHTTGVSKEMQREYVENAYSVLKMLSSLDDNRFFFFMRALRMIQLANENLRGDFSLAYSLLIAAIEAVAQRAISRKKVARKYEREGAWSCRARKDTEFREVYAEFKKLLDSNRFLKKRFVSFILEYCPLQDRDNLPHPYKEMNDYHEEIFGSKHSETFLQDRWDTIKPAQLDLASARRLLEDAYNSRSQFIHSGKPPRNQDPGSHSHYFEQIFEANEKGFRTVIVPTYRLLDYIARRSILGYLRALDSDMS